MRQRVVMLCCCLGLFYNALAQTPYTIGINGDDGLNSDVVYDILEDTRGFVWLATGSGLIRYDGETYKSIGAEGERSRIGSHLTEDRYGRIWMESFDGSLFYTQSDKLILLDERKPIGFFRYFLDDNHIIHLYKNEVVIYDLQTLKIQKTIERKGANTFHTINTNKEFHILGSEEWVIDTGGGVRTKPLQQIMKGMTPILTAMDGDQVYFTSKDNSQKKLFLYDHKKTTEVFSIPELNFIQNLIYIDKMFWFCCSDGLYIYDRQGKMVGGVPFFKDISVSSVMKDRNGGYWVGTVTEGAQVIRNFDHTLLSMGADRPHRLAVLDGEVVVGTKNGKLISIDGQSFSKPFYTSKGNHGIFYLEANTYDDQLYATSNEFLIFSKNKDLIFQNIGSIKDAEPLDGKYLIVAASGNVGFFDLPWYKGESKWDTFYKKNQYSPSVNGATILEGRGKSVAYDEANDAIFFCSNQGFFRQTLLGLEEIKRDGKTINYTRIEKLEDDIFALTSTGKIERFSLKDLNTHEELRSLEGEDWKHIKVINNKIYVASDHQLATFENKGGKFQIVFVFSISGKDEIYDFTKNGDDFYIATEAGIIVVPEYKSVRDIEPKFYLDRMFIRGQELKGVELNQLSYDQNEVTFEFSIASYPASQKLPVYYSLNGNDWNRISDGSRTLKLDALRPGYYSVGFRVGENGEVFNAPVFIVRRPFWESYWFYIGVGLIVVAAGFGYYRYQTRLLKTQNRLLLEKVSLEKDLQTAMLQSIKSQMNPHFFYNALNTIQSFIFTDDKRNAGIFLSKFSQLTRMILEMSEKETVSVSEELQALNLYLEIESARFNYDLNYKIEVDTELDVEMCRLPSMIVQPYVENAIKHGLLHKKDDKQLMIRFKREQKNIRIEIEDNGIGRARSRELNRIKNKGHQSFATEANSRRLELLNRKHGNVGVEFEDKVAASGEGIGTLVIIRIPLI
ncbi:MAG: histidine kinase [Flavobacteriales bacterium]